MLSSCVRWWLEWYGTSKSTRSEMITGLNKRTYEKQLLDPPASEDMQAVAVCAPAQDLDVGKEGPLAIRRLGHQVVVRHVNERRSLHHCIGHTRERDALRGIIIFLGAHHFLSRKNAVALHSDVLRAPFAGIE